MRSLGPHKGVGVRAPGFFRYMVAIALAAVILFSLFGEVYGLTPIITANEFYDALGRTESSSFEYVGSTRYIFPPGWTMSGPEHNPSIPGGGMRWKGNRRPDLNEDGTINMYDVGFAARLFGCDNNNPVYYSTTNGIPNSFADFKNDGRIDMRDIAIVARQFSQDSAALDGVYAWYIGGSGEYFMSRYVEDYCLPALEGMEDVGGQYFVFGLWYFADQVYDANASARAELLCDYGTYQSTFEGVWTAPVLNNWTAVYVTGYACLGLQSIQANIHIQNMSAFVDAATVSSFTEDETEGTFGSLSVGTNMFSYKRTIGPALDGEVIAVPTLYAEAASGYRIKWIELTVTCLTRSGTYNLNIPYCTQSNDKAYVVDPAAIEGRENDQLFAAGLIIPIVVTGVLTFGVGAIPAVEGAGTMAVVSRFIASTTVGAGLKFILRVFASDPDHPTADGGGQGDAVWEHWPYVSASFNEGDFVNSANAAYDLHWTFDTSSHLDFVVIIEAKACFAEPVYEEVYPGVSVWILHDRATYEAWREISILT